MDSTFYLSNLGKSGKDVILESTEQSPFVKYSNRENALRISGNSFMEDAHQFYSPFLDKIYNDLTETGDAILELHFSAFGPKTAKVLFALFDNLRTFKQVGKEMNIIWKCNTANESMSDLGESFSELFDLTFQFKYSD